MNAKQLAAWIKEEQEKISGITRQLMEKISIVPRIDHDRWLADVRALFEHYRAHTIRHIALEEQDGYLTPVTEARPFLSKEVDRLQHEHRELIRLIDAVHRDLPGIQAGDLLLLRDICHRIQDVLQYMEHHEKEETLLLMSAFTDDTGEKD